MRIRCTTTFDITATGVTGHFRPSRLPFNDMHGTVITDESTWAKSRNQQRNWETITQVISLRTQTQHTYPVETNKVWSFEFEVENGEVYANNTSPFGLLLNDCADVPMLVNLTESRQTEIVLRTTGDTQNIWFEVI